MDSIEKEFIPYELALELKQIGFDNFSFGRFYTKPSCKMFSIDEKGRHYPIKNTPKKLYTTGEHFVLKDENIIIAPTYAQCFRFFREKHEIDSAILPTSSTPYQFRLYHKLQDTIKVQLYADYMGKEYKTYEEAELECLKKLIEIVKGGNK